MSRLGGDDRQDPDSPLRSSQGRDPDFVQGERGTPTVNSTTSVQSRVSSVLAAGLMIVLGVGALSWYYANAFSRQKRARQAAQTASANNAQGEMPLPSLGRIESPRVAPSVAAPAVLLPPPAPQLPLEQARSDWNAASGSAASYGPSIPYGSSNSYAPPEQYRSPRRDGVSDRRLSGAAFSRDAAQGSPASASAAATDLQDSDTPFGTLANRLPANGFSNTRVEGGLAALLRPGTTPSARALTLPSQRLLLPKGAFIDCTLETAIDSTLPGMTTCVTATDTFGVDGKVVLLERGSKLVGETRGEVQNGAARVFVVWTEARTPTGVLVPLDSPGTDELGRSGLPGEVNRHFWDRFGAAMLISVIDGALQAAVQSTSRSGGAVIYNPASSQEVLSEVLKGTINVAPAVVKHQGDRIQILVARDLDFRPVYELRSAAAGR